MTAPSAGPLNTGQLSADAKAADAGMWRPVGPLAEGECQAPTDQPCGLRPAWRITVLDQLDTPSRPEAPLPRMFTAGNTPDSWLVCTPHLGESIALCDGSYASPLLVEVHHG